MDYRKEIDGLRALAILPVVLFHSGLPMFNWGYIGVDIFFVISGYLITCIIFPKIEKREFAFSWFYENRIRRLFPALFLMIVFSSLMSLLLLDPIKLVEFSYSVFSSIFFYSNFFFWQEIDYFESTSELMPLLHTWSLSIEEQFYILFPILLILLVRFLHKRLLSIIFAIGSVSLALWIYGNIYFQTATFYLPITRAWELIAGAFLAIFVYRYGYLKNKYTSTIGLFIIFFSFYIFSLGGSAKNIFMLLPVLGTLMILAAKNHSSFLKLLLQNKISIFFGLISYSLYLFHQPVFAFAKIYFIDLGYIEVIAFIGFSILLSFFSWNYVEKIFRKRFNSQINFSKMIPILCLPILVSISIAIFSIKTEGNKQNYLSSLSSVEMQTYSLLEGVKKENENDLFFNNNDCIISSNNFSNILELKILECEKKYGKGILFFGDSHAKDIFNSYQHIDQREFIIGISANFCQAHETINHCYFLELRDFLNSYPNVFQKIFFHQAGYFFLGQDGIKFNNKGFLEELALNDTKMQFEISRDRVMSLRENLKGLAENIVVIGPRIEPHIQNKYIKKFSCKHKFLTRENLTKSFHALDQIFKETFTASEYISLQEIIKFSIDKDFMNCEEIYWADGDHWSKSGEIHFSERLARGLSI